MRAPLSWIRDFTPVDAPVDEIVAALNQVGLEVDAVEAPGAEVLGVRVANLHTIEAVAHMQKLMWVAAPHARAVYIVNAHTLNLACDDPSYRAVPSPSRWWL